MCLVGAAAKVSNCTYFVVLFLSIIFILLNYCLLPLQSENSSHSPTEFKALIGKKLLLLIDTSSVSTSAFDGFGRVRRWCMDPKVIKTFEEIGLMITPIKVSLYDTQFLWGFGRTCWPAYEAVVSSNVIWFFFQSIVHNGGVAYDEYSCVDVDDSDNSSEDCECVEETEAAEFADDCIVSPMDLKNKNIVGKEPSSILKMSLVKEFEEVETLEKKHVLKVVKTEKDWVVFLLLLLLHCNASLNNGHVFVQVSFWLYVCCVLYYVM
jgi:hypothetical protein